MLKGSQIDLPSKQHSGLKEAARILKDVKGIGFVELNEKDVVRHKYYQPLSILWTPVPRYLCSFFYHGVTESRRDHGTFPTKHVSTHGLAAVSLREDFL